MTHTVYLDIETTGLEPETNELLEIGIIDDAGDVVLHSLVRPVSLTRWDDALAVHGISSDDVRDAPTLEDLRPDICAAVTGRAVIAYNAPFEQAFLPDELATADSVRCCMAAFAECHGSWNDYYGNREYVSLAAAARHVRFTWPGPAHRAIADCQATRAVWHYLEDPALQADIAAQIEAESLLRDQAWVDRRREDRFRDRMSHFWLRWLRLRPPAPRLGHSAADSLEAYHQLFTGHSQSVWQQLREPRLQELPVYRRRRDIPAHLKTRHALKRVTPTWILNELTPTALLVSSAGKTLSRLYSVTEIQTVRERHPHRYDDWAAVPDGLASKTELRRRGIDVARLGLRSVADVCHHSPRGIRFVPLYRAIDALESNC